MTALPALTAITNGTPNDATPVDGNFDLIKAHIDGELINADGSTAMTAELTLSSSTPSGALVAASKAYVDAQPPPDGSVTTAKLANDSVTTAKIAQNTITANEIGPGAVNSSEIAAGAVDSSEIATGAVTQAKLAASSGGSIDGGLILYRRLGDMVYVWTTTNGSNDRTNGGTLPSGFRPGSVVYGCVFRSTSAAGELEIETNGVITCSSHPSAEFSFSVAFVAA